MFEVLGSAGRMRQWTAVARGGGPDWEDIFRGYRACVDFPAAAYWRELAAHYPEAKVILTLRDPDAWFESARKTIFRLPRLMRHPVLGPLLRLLLPRRSRPAMFIRMLGALNRDRRDIAFDRDSALAYFERHNAEVMASVPAERLLVYRVGRAGSRCARSSAYRCPTSRFRGQTTARVSGPISTGRCGEGHRSGAERAGNRGRKSRGRARA
nr:hypothetical protein GCM10020093_118970 [Planobispora longispora]BFE89449.1 hypothetical protein GCM10020093_120510 [Planobispora longispora]